MTPSIRGGPESAGSAVAVDASYAACRRIARRAKSNFYPGFMLLPREKRRAMDALYAFMRRTDDLADSHEPAQRRRESLFRWRTSLEQALTGSVDREDTGPPQCVVSDLFEEFSGMAILPALADTVGRFGIPVEHLYAVIDGVEMDLTAARYETFDELEQYCQRVASAVGLACIHIWGFRGNGAVEPARKCGIAVQLTNILRDMKEDADRGRMYLPLEDLRKCDYTAEDLLAGVPDERFDRLLAMEVTRVEKFYREGGELADYLEPDGRRIFGLMMATYRALLKKIAARPKDVFSGRIRLGAGKKLRLAARWMLLPV